MPGAGRGSSAPIQSGATTTVAGEMAESTSTRDLLLDAAARLFAERGIDNVSMAEIVRAADQRNASAVHYHFGSRDEVLRAVLARHVPGHRRPPAPAPRTGPGRPDDDVALGRRGHRAPGHRVRPAGLAGAGLPADRLGADRGARPDHARDPGPAGRRPRATQAWDLLRQRCPEVPADLWRVRREICIVFIGRAAADRARRLDRGRRRRACSSDDRFVDNLIDMVIGAMTAPHVGG